MHPNDAYTDLPPAFHCRPLLADISAATCKTNFLAHKGVSCRGCAVGMMHAAVKSRTAIDALNDETLNRHERAMAKNSLSCTRCEKTSHTNTRLQGAMRLVKHATICVSCFNREREVIKGENSKGSTPKKWGGLKPTTILIRKNAKLKRIDIGLTTGVSEARRHAERRKFELVKIWIDDVLAYEAKQRKTGARKLEQISSETYPAEMAAKPTTPIPGSGPAEPSAPIPVTAAPAAVAEFVSEPVDPVADELSSPRPIAEDEQDESEWAGCCTTMDGRTVLVTDYAREHGVTNEAAA
ncbi:hypothetical protein P3T18_004449 [Paraburkholderia sp. GAS199]|uniref:hypothetical protein n=1 Tax=Paraburkholderia sp. GAS199 TaxID=3035126 RepID=UPI003D1CE859